MSGSSVLVTKPYSGCKENQPPYADHLSTFLTRKPGRHDGIGTGSVPPVENESHEFVRLANCNDLADSANVDMAVAVSEDIPSKELRSDAPESR